MFFRRTITLSKRNAWAISRLYLTRDSGYNPASPKQATNIPVAASVKFNTGCSVMVAIYTSEDSTMTTIATLMKKTRDDDKYEVLDIKLGRRFFGNYSFADKFGNTYRVAIRKRKTYKR